MRAISDSAVSELCSLTRALDTLLFLNCVRRLRFRICYQRNSNIVLIELSEPHSGFYYKKSDYTYLSESKVHSTVHEIIFSPENFSAPSIPEQEGSREDKLQGQLCRLWLILFKPTAPAPSLCRACHWSSRRRIRRPASSQHRRIVESAVPMSRRRPSIVASAVPMSRRHPSIIVSSNLPSRCLGVVPASYRRRYCPSDVPASSRMHHCIRRMPGDTKTQRRARGCRDNSSTEGQHMSAVPSQCHPGFVASAVPAWCCPGAVLALYRFVTVASSSRLILIIFVVFVIGVKDWRTSRFVRRFFGVLVAFLVLWLTRFR